jgi:uncharacterized protein
MKLSQFNNTVRYDDSIILYNSFSNQFLSVDPLDNDLIESAKIIGNIDDLLIYAPVLYIDMIEKGFIVGEYEDEIQKVKDVQARVDLEDDSLYRLIINPTMNCNFKCWYCYEAHIKDSRMEEQTISHVMKHIDNVIQNMPQIKRFTISWFGGEPLLYFDRVIDPIMNFASNRFIERNINFDTDFTTNGYLIREKMIEKFHSYNISNFQITLDGNREQHDKVRYVSKSRGSYDEIVENILMLCRNKLRVALRINYTKQNLQDLERIVWDLLPLEEQYKEYLIITFHKVWQEEDLTLGDKIKNLRLFFKSHGFQTANGDIPNTLRQSCYADRKNHATINYNGEVFKCTARNFSSNAKEGDLKEDGSIEWNEKFHQRMNIKFKNKPCLSCPIMPICNGGCSQVAIESKGEDYCVYNFDEQRKKEIVLEKYLQKMSFSAV